MNGDPIDSKEIVADGRLHDIQWNVDITESSWIAVRILPSVHTNPIFVEVGGHPIRPNMKSAEWCRRAVDVCWESKKGQIRESEIEDARAAYDRAAEVYDQIIKESQ